MGSKFLTVPSPSLCILSYLCQTWPTCRYEYRPNDHVIYSPTYLDNVCLMNCFDKISSTLCTVKFQNTCMTLCIHTILVLFLYCESPVDLSVSSYFQCIGIILLVTCMTYWQISLGRFHAIYGTCRSSYKTYKGTL